MNERPTLRQCLTVAGSDSGAGAGMQADLKTFSANGVYGLSVVTSVTAQNTQAVLHAHDLPVSVIQGQLEAVWDDFEISALKTGMLSSAAIVETVAAFLADRGIGRGGSSVEIQGTGRGASSGEDKGVEPGGSSAPPQGMGLGEGSGIERGGSSAPRQGVGPGEGGGRGAPPLVVDPVMISKSGYPLLAEDAVEAVRARLLPLAFLVTPNRHEAELLAGMTLRGKEDLSEVAARILALGPRAVLLKGGHLEEEEAADYLYGRAGTAATAATPSGAAPTRTEPTRAASTGPDPTGPDPTGDAPTGVELLGRFTSPRFDTTSTHGTGCTLSAAICARLALGRSLVDAVAEAKVYIREAIRNGLAIGHGHGPTDHFYFLRGRAEESPS